MIRTAVFFEQYEEDAAIGHREFDLKLTDRVKMKMVGVPEASFDFWAAKVSAGFPFSSSIIELQN